MDRISIVCIQTWAHLGLYFSNKLRAAVDYQRFKNTGKSQFHGQAVNWLEKAITHWGQVVSITSPIYDPMPLQHYERNDHAYFHWSKVESEVVEELEWLKSVTK